MYGSPCSLPDIAHQLMPQVSLRLCAMEQEVDHVKIMNDTQAWTQQNGAKQLS